MDGHDGRGRRSTSLLSNQGKRQPAVGESSHEVLSKAGERKRREKVSRRRSRSRLRLLFQFRREKAGRC